jgi:hypothetical protein
MKILLISLITLISLLTPTAALARESYWEIQSIDTMKFSRDLAREKLNDVSFGEIIKMQVAEIAVTGATHVAIGTPYDEEFIPFLEMWVRAARANNLNVWFRGNFSGWEGWFGYQKIGKEEHLQKTKDFILNNPQLFEDGDIFTSCVECENGGPGDPRDTKNVSGYRQFLITEYEVTRKAFKQIGKNVKANYFSMNGDVAYLVMDKKTTQALGGIVVIDHYVKDPKQLSKDIRQLSERSEGNIILGEFGVPIPDIHGVMTEYEQALWIDKALFELANIKDLAGINYWTGFGGTTNIWRDDGSEKSGVEVLSGYYTPKVLSGIVVNELGRGVKGAKIISNGKAVETNKNGEFAILIVPGQNELTIDAKSYNQEIIKIEKMTSSEILLVKNKENIFFKIAKLIYNFFNGKS